MPWMSIWWASTAVMAWGTCWIRSSRRSAVTITSATIGPAEDAAAGPEGDVWAVAKPALAVAQISAVLPKSARSKVVLVIDLPPCESPRCGLRERLGS